MCSFAMPKTKIMRRYKFCLCFRAVGVVIDDCLVFAGEQAKRMEQAAVISYRISTTVNCFLTLFLTPAARTVELKSQMACIV